MKKPREPIPKIVNKLRYLAREDCFPRESAKLKRLEVDLLRTIKSLGTPPAMWQYLQAYRNAASYIHRLTGDHWNGE